MFKAIQLTKGATFDSRVVDIDEAALPAGDVTVRVEYSTLNYKDGLAIANQSPVVCNWPMVAGIDGAGTVSAPSHPDWKVGDKFVHNGGGVGETHWGYLSATTRLKGNWLVKLPSAFTARQAMAIGTAGYTSMLCVLALEDHGVKPVAGEILVTGATGGVGLHRRRLAGPPGLYGGRCHRQGERRGLPQGPRGHIGDRPRRPGGARQTERSAAAWWCGWLADTARPTLRP